MGEALFTEPIDIGRDDDTGEWGVHVGDWWSGGHRTAEECYTALGEHIYTRGLADGQEVAGRITRPCPNCGEYPDDHTCRECGCSDVWPCEPPCGWAEEDLCTACVPEEAEADG